MTDFQQYESAIHCRSENPLLLSVLVCGQSLQDSEPEEPFHVSQWEVCLLGLGRPCSSKGNGNLSSGRRWSWLKQRQVLGFPLGMSFLPHSISGHLGWEMETALNWNNLGQGILQLLLQDLLCSMQGMPSQEHGCQVTKGALCVLLHPLALFPLPPSLTCLTFYPRQRWDTCFLYWFQGGLSTCTWKYAIFMYTQREMGEGTEGGREGRGRWRVRERERENTDYITHRNSMTPRDAKRKLWLTVLGVYLAGPGPLMAHVFNCQFSLSLHEKVSSFMFMAKTSNCA